MNRLICIATATAVIAALAQQRPAQAQDYPSKQVTIVVPLAAGSGVDLVARVYGEQLGKVLGKPVVVENRTGAATMIGTSFVAASPPDGHTLLAATSSAMAINPVLYKKVSYDPNRDFVPINFYLKSPFVLCVHPDLPVRSVTELVKHAKERPTPSPSARPAPAPRSICRSSTSSSDSRST